MRSCSPQRGRKRVPRRPTAWPSLRASTSFRDALFHAARCRTDELGSFAAADVVVAAARSNAQAPSLLSLQYPLKKLTEPERGAVLRRVLRPGGWRYQFSSQTLRH
jgi:hypothetical protein